MILCGFVMKQAKEPCARGEGHGGPHSSRRAMDRRRDHIADVRTVPMRIDPELGAERWCSWCEEWWPYDEEFWYFQKKRVLGRCRACWVEFNRERRLTEKRREWKRAERARKKAAA